MRDLTALIALTMVALVVAAPRVATAADDTSVAREHFEKGKAFMDLGKYNEAAAEYEAAYADKPDPTLLLNLAQAYRQAGNGEKALRFYRKYLQYVPRSPYRADIEDKIAALEKQQGKTPGEGTTTVTPAPESSTASPAPPANTSPPPPPPAPPTYTPPPPVDPYPPYPGATPAPVGATPVRAAGPVDHGKNLKLAGLVTGGVGVASVVLGAVFGAQAKDAQKKVEDGAVPGSIFNANLQDQDARGRAAQTKEVTFLVIGVAALAGGGALYYYGRRQGSEVAAGPRAAHTVALLPAASKTDLGAALRVTF
jgi:tetratricopeptide (TPR) repeat protein